MVGPVFLCIIVHYLTWACTPGGRAVRVRVTSPCSRPAIPHSVRDVGSALHRLPAAKLSFIRLFLFQLLKKKDLSWHCIDFLLKLRKSGEDLRDGLQF